MANRMLNQIGNKLQFNVKKVFVTVILPLILNNLSTKHDDFGVYQDANVNFINTYLRTSDGIEIGLWILEPEKIDMHTKFIVLLHGIGQNRKRFVEDFDLCNLFLHNYVLFVPDYRSFGDSEGYFTMSDVNLDIDAVYHYCINKYRSKPDFIGYSFGAAVALNYVKYKQHKQKIVLISTFSRLVDMLLSSQRFEGQKQYVSQHMSMLKEFIGYDNMKNIMYCKPENVIVFHGNCDEIIHYSQGKKLANERGCKFITMDGCDHANVFEWDQLYHEINAFLK
ncbi:Protein abhd12b [Binucleata daphniae]